MTITKIIEYVIINGTTSIKGEDFTDENETGAVKVVFEAYPRWEDEGIGSYEYWGMKGYDSRPYLSCEYNGIEWDKEKYSQRENDAIDAWLGENWESLESRFCEEFKNEANS